MPAAEPTRKFAHQMAVECGEIIEVEDEDGGEEEEEVSIGEMIRHCQQLEGLCNEYSAVESSLDLSQQLCRFRGYLRRTELKNAKQVTLDELWGSL